MEQPTDGRITTRLGPLHVQTMGSGPTAVLWHSLFADSNTWNRVRQPLAETRRLLLIDGPAHGRSPAPLRRYSLGDCVGAAVDVLDHLGIREPVDWLGNAWGGHVGVLFAADHPDRCRSLMAIGSPVHALSPRDRRQTVLLSALYRISGPAPFVNLLVDALLGPDARATDPRGAAIVADALRRAGRRGMYAAVRSVSVQRPDLTSVLGRIDAPTLLTTGTDDPMWTAADARAAATHLTCGSLVILPGAGHIGPLLQAAPAMVELVSAFWEDPQGTVAMHRSGKSPFRPPAA